MHVFLSSDSADFILIDFDLKIDIKATAERLDSASKSSDKRRKETREGRKRDGA